MEHPAPLWAYVVLIDVAVWSLLFCRMHVRGQERRARYVRQQEELEQLVQDFRLMAQGVRPTAATRARDHESYSRARDLLKTVLTPEQWDDYEKTRKFKVTGSAGGRYIISRGIWQNVIKVDTFGRPVEQLCAGRSGLPEPDVLVTQTLLLQADERRFRKTATILDLTAF